MIMTNNTRQPIAAAVGAELEWLADADLLTIQTGHGDTMRSRYYLDPAGTVRGPIPPLPAAHKHPGIRGIMFGLLFAVPFWLCLIGAAPFIEWLMGGAAA